MSEPRTYTIEELAGLVNFTSSYIKMLLVNRMKLDPTQPISEETAATIAKRLKRAWPPDQSA